MTESVFERFENIVKKGEISGYQPVLLFQQAFKATFSQDHKSTGVLNRE